MINREKGKSLLVHADEIRHQGEYEEQSEEEISTIPFVNDLLKQSLQNETSEDEIMHDQMGQNAFKKSDKDQIMQEDDRHYNSLPDRCRSPRE